MCVKLINKKGNYISYPYHFLGAKTIFTMLILLFMGEGAFAQLTAEGPPISSYIDHYAKVIPKTPNAGTFKEYGNVETDIAKGTPNINIPIYTIELDGFSLPISLSYDASGIKVGQMSSAVGLNWSLNATAGIFRNINFIPDEEGWLDPHFGPRSEAWYVDHPISDWTTQRALSTIPYDHDPDDFNYSAFGYSGNFIFKQEDIDSIIKERKDNFRIKTIYTELGNHFSIDAFEGMDPNGNTYTFDIEERNYSLAMSGSPTAPLGSPSSNVTDQRTGWLVRQINTRNGKKITFTYEEYAQDYTLSQISRKITSGRRKKYCDETDYCVVFATSGIEDMFYVYEDMVTTVQYKPKNKLIHRIDTENESIIFNYQTDTALKDWQRKLVSIQIVDNISNTSRYFTLTHGIYAGDARLRLDAVKESGMPPYEFTYNQTSPLPAKDSYSQDLFGFQNGKQNSMPIPFTEHAYSLLPPFYVDRLADKRPDFAYLNNGNLTSIQYPTGGETHFEYQINSEDQSEQSMGEYIYKETDVLVDTSSPYITEDGGLITAFRKTFTITDDVLQTVSIPGGTFENSIEVNSENSICAPWDPETGLGNIDCSRYYIYNAIPSGSHYLQGSQVFDPAKSTGTKGAFELDSGTYWLVLKVKTALLASNPVINVKLHYISRRRKANGQFWRERYSGGLIVKSVTDKDFGSKQRKKIFRYSGLSGVNKLANDGLWGFEHRKVFSSDYIGHRQHFKGGYYYSKVEVAEVANDCSEPCPFNFDNRVEYEFEADEKNYSYDCVLKKQRTFVSNLERNSSTSTYVDVGLENQFWLQLGTISYCYWNGTEFFCGGTMGTALPKDKYNLGYNLYQPMVYISKAKRISSNIQVEKLDSDSLTVSSAYSYNSYHLLSEKTTSFSDGIVHKESYKYSSDFASTTPFNSLIENYNMVEMSVLLEKFDITGPTIQLAGTANEFTADGNIYKTYAFDRGIGSNASTASYIPANYEEKATFTIIGGVPRYVSKKDGILTCYIWDSRNKYLLATVSNTSKFEMGSYVTNPLNLSNENDSTVMLYFNNMRTALPNAQITSYTYKPLVGVSSVTDPKGDFFKYHYDFIGRLKFIKDKEGNLLSEHQYNYRNQN